MTNNEDFQQWLECFNKEITKGYERRTMSSLLAGHVYKDKSPRALIKLGWLDITLPPNPNLHLTSFTYD